MGHCIIARVASCGIAVMVPPVNLMLTFWPDDTNAMGGGPAGLMLPSDSAPKPILKRGAKKPKA